MSEVSRRRFLCSLAVTVAAAVAARASSLVAAAAAVEIADSTEPGDEAGPAPSS